ncbi:transforming acidic coiled-coil-containing protein 1 isoform X1 [Astyanax mexicanus]|uniref:Transforming acidic coiled-coil-containing protein 1 isoform X1 n=1 Tax=Astyanax mexicanus TaxID=7994 RepID=A0A8T2L265_ASTMX|nr:transforming acidic coiled-coil-containing protein 1 isoform X1 [Astyanax mexicanus]
MSWLSPVQWAKWTWSAVRGAGEEEDGEMREEEEDCPQEGDEEEEKSQSYRQDQQTTDKQQQLQEGQFETPETETPVHHALTDPAALAPPTGEPAGIDLDDDDQEIPVTKETEQISILHPQPLPSIMTVETAEDPTHTLSSQPVCNGHLPERSQTSVPKARPPSLKMKSPLNAVDPNEVDDEPPPLPKGSYSFDPNQCDLNFNPFASGSSKMQNSPVLPKGTYNFDPDNFDSLDSLDPFKSSSKGLALSSDSAKAETDPLPASSSIPKAQLPDPESNSQSEAGEENLGSKRIPQQKQGKRPGTKVTPKKQRAKALTDKSEVSEQPSHPECDSSAPLNVDDIPISKKSYNFDPNQWDDPNFNPFGGTSKMSNSPTLSKGAYTFDPDNFDDSVDPFKPSKAFGASNDSTKAETEISVDILDKQTNQERPLVEERKARQSPKKNKDRIITTTEQVRFLCLLLNTCKVKKYENKSLVQDVCSQGEEVQEEPVSPLELPVQHATDEEKLASTGMVQKEPNEKNTDDLPVGKTDHFSEKEICTPTEGLCKSQALIGCEKMEKVSPSLDSIPLSEMDKAAVLTLIREEIITKEIEANEWKRKYEDSRMELTEMRKIVAEYEKTVAQMIEDEQRKTMGSQKSVQQLTLERDQALADLNSVERSLSDLFRRYENMKTVLEGFKKNEEVLKKCAQEYLARVKQEEQRYHTLKLHAEEKLDKANEEIAQVRSRANAESVALNASLRKEQMKVESLERALEQKNQEMEELTKICDELIAKLGTTD